MKEKVAQRLFPHSSHQANHVDKVPRNNIIYHYILTASTVHAKSSTTAHLDVTSSMWWENNYVCYNHTNNAYFLSQLVYQLGRWHRRHVHARFTHITSQLRFAVPQAETTRQINRDKQVHRYMHIITNMTLPWCGFQVQLAKANNIIRREERIVRRCALFAFYCNIDPICWSDGKAHIVPIP